MGHVIEVLRCKASVSASWVMTNSTYGIGKDQSHEYWLSVLRQLIHKGLLYKNITAIWFTADRRARPVLRVINR